jgi:hypothetical protein
MKKLLLFGCAFELLASLPMGMSFAQQEGQGPHAITTAPASRSRSITPVSVITPRTVTLVTKIGPKLSTSTRAS